MNNMKLSCKKYFFFLLLFVFAGAVSSCIYEEVPVEEEDETTVRENGDVINITVTLDRMGGAQTKAVTAAYLEEIEDYVDPEKLRVLLFDSEDKFLFESKSRWIKQLDNTASHSVWSVSIPLYSFGNDSSYDWEWGKIREKLTTGQFKVAILANRPDREWNMGILKKDENNDDIPGEYHVLNGWFGSNGPYWTRKNSVVYDGDDKDVKDVFDLHHCQYDPIYHGKNYYTTLPRANTTEVDYSNHNFDFYGSVTGPDNPEERDPERPLMGATSSWVDWGQNDDVRDPQGWKFRKNKYPDKEYPIPMYGIQSFNPLSGWKKGTTVNLNRTEDKPVSLLRSVVRLELVVPKDAAAHVLLFYSNIYARCEPMDVWTPTDVLWTTPSTHATECEWTLVKDFGRMTIQGDPYRENNLVTLGSIAGSKQTYQERLSWLYGIWRKEKDWSFDNADTETKKTYEINSYFDKKYPDKEGTEDRFVRIFNPCTQRVTALYVEKAYSDGINDHYIVYTGERNVNDASNLGQMGNTGSGNPTILYWTLVDDTEKTKIAGSKTKYYYQTFSLPIVNYSEAGAVAAVTHTGYVMKGQTPGNGTKEEPDTSENDDSSSTGMGLYLQDVHNNSIAAKYWPLPLLRNHVYQLTLGGTTAVATRSGDAGKTDISVRLDHRYTEDISFK